MNKERVIVLIDGNNFYHRLKELEFKNLLTFDYSAFGGFLAGPREVVAKKYYVGSVREEEGNVKSRELMAGQQKLLGRLERNGWQLGLGHMLKTDKYREKGVDVLIAVDLLVGAYDNLYDTAILVSSDTDLIPALDKARSRGRKIEYVGFSHKPSLALIARSDIRRLLRSQDIEPFVAKAGQ